MDMHEKINSIHIDMIYLLPVIGLTFGGSSTIHIYTQTKQNNTMKTEYTEHT